MKLNSKFIVLAALCCLLAGCNGFTLPSQTDTAAALNQTQAELHQLQADLHAQQTASTQPNATQPAPPASAVKAVDDLTKQVDRLTAVVNTLPASPNPGQVVTAVAPLTGPAAPWVALGGMVLTAVWGLFQKKNANASAAALATTTDGLKAAVSTGAITVTANAPAIVDAAVTNHPATSAIVDLLSDAAKTPRIV